MMSLSVKGKLFSGFSVLTAITLILGAAAYRAIVVIDHAADEIDRKTTERNLSDAIDNTSLRESITARTYLLTGDESFRTAYESAKQEYQKNLEDLNTHVKSEEGKRLFAAIKSKHEPYVAIVDHEVDLKHERKDKEAVRVMYTQAVPAFKAVDQATNDFVEHIIKSKEAIDHQQDADVTNSKLIIFVLCITGVVLSVGLSWLLARSVSGGMARMIGTIHELANNNLSVEDLEVRQDEVGQAGLALNTMKTRLREMIRSISETAEHVASASEEISSSAEEQAQSSANQKDQTAQVASALQEMSSTVMQVSENSSRAAEASRKAAETARQGGSIVDQTLNKMQVIAESVRSTSIRVEELGKSSDQIGRIIGVINDIADQTNLLALNAAIEAARAGEQGRGFAVVADEVRKLAERTTTATKEIAQMIQTVQQETKLAVGAMEQGTQQVEEGVQTTNKAGEALKEIIKMSEQVGDMIIHIATAATQQSTATEQINNSMDQIAGLVKESAAGAQQSAKACQDLSRQAFDLQKLVSNFKLRGDSDKARSGGQSRGNGASSGFTDSAGERAFAAGAS